MKFSCCLIFAVIGVCTAPLIAEENDSGMRIPSLELIAEQGADERKHIVEIFIRNSGTSPATIPRFVSEEGVQASQSLKAYVQRGRDLPDMPKPYGVSPLFLFANYGASSSEYTPGGHYTLRPREKKLLFRNVVNDAEDGPVRLWFTLCIPVMGQAKNAGEIALLLRSNTLTIPTDLGGAKERAGEKERKGVRHKERQKRCQAQVASLPSQRGAIRLCALSQTEDEQLKFIELKSSQLPDDVRFFVEVDSTPRRTLRIMFVVRDVQGAKALISPQFKLLFDGKQVFDGTIDAPVSNIHIVRVHVISCTSDVGSLTFEPARGFSLGTFSCSRK